VSMKSNEATVLKFTSIASFSFSLPIIFFGV
jgi:hypothetical protein